MKPTYSCIKFILLIVIAILPNLRCRTTPFDTTPREAATEQLGKRLFFDPRLSRGDRMSCASCHQPARAFTNGERVATGVHGDKGERNVPTLVTRAGTRLQFWDGRASSLEDQALAVITAHGEMDGDLQVAIAKLRDDGDYPTLFARAFGSHKIDAARISQALAAFERTLRPGLSPYDRYVAGDTQALSAAQIRGMNLFSKFQCIACHKGPNFTDETLRPRCYPATSNLNQLVPIRIGQDKFVKTPTLRNLIYTAPYMHNGSLNHLEDVVDFYTPSFQAGDDLLPDTTKPVVVINKKDRSDLVAFLKSLSSSVPFEESYSNR